MTARTGWEHEIVDTLSAHGRGFAMSAPGLQWPFPFRRGPPGHEPGRMRAQPEHPRLPSCSWPRRFVKGGADPVHLAGPAAADYLGELAKLQDDTASARTDESVAAIAQELGPAAAFDTPDPPPRAVVCIGQGYAAVAGAQVAAWRRTDVVEAVEQDLQLSWTRRAGEQPLGMRPRARPGRPSRRLTPTVCATSWTTGVRR